MGKAQFVKPSGASKTLTKLMVKFPEVEVWAGGGIVHRRANKVPEVLLVHRPQHRDWSFPKGKLSDDETLKQCALREVFEETGLRCRTGKKLPLVTYRDAQRRNKAVLYWTMNRIDGGFSPNDEVDAMGWFDFESAAATLTYGHDVDLLAGIAPRIFALG